MTWKVRDSVGEGSILRKNGEGMNDWAGASSMYGVS